MFEPNPRIDSFEIKHNGNILWSKLLFKKFPTKQVLETRISNYFQDIKNNKNLKKYSQLNSIPVSP